MQDRSFTMAAVGASAIGTGGSADTTLDGGFRCALRFKPGPGARFHVTDIFTQTNAVAYDGPGMSEVPLPAGPWL